MSSLKRRKELWQQNPKCIYCGVETVWVNSINNGIRKDYDLWMRCATIEHLYSRLNPFRDHDRGELKYIACYKCNEEKAFLEQDLFENERRIMKVVKKGQNYLMNRKSKEYRTKKFPRWEYLDGWFKKRKSVLSIVSSIIK